MYFDDCVFFVSVFAQKASRREYGRLCWNQGLRGDDILAAEIDISASKLLGFETFAKSWRVSVSENLVSEKSLGFSFEKIWSRKKVSVSVSEKLVS